MQDKAQKHWLRLQAQSTEVERIDGVTVGVPKGLSDEEYAQFVADVKSELANPDSEFNVAKRKRKASRQRFDERRSSLDEAIAAKNQRKINEAYQRSQSNT